jgi:hypothetical protein
MNMDQEKRLELRKILMKNLGADVSLFLDEN